MSDKAEMMPGLTDLMLRGETPANDRDALDYAASEDPEMRALRGLMRHKGRKGGSSGSSSRGRKRRPKSRPTSR